MFNMDLEIRVDAHLSSRGSMIEQAARRAFFLFLSLWKGRISGLLSGHGCMKDGAALPFAVRQTLLAIHIRE